MNWLIKYTQKAVLHLTCYIIDVRLTDTGTKSKEEKKSAFVHSRSYGKRVHVQMVFQLLNVRTSAY